ncbi:MAG: hypothetical protein MH137_10175 [Flavobacteriales bacterium]|nr:hypothetical protein [Flavobacteriales bacterium]
MKKAFIFLNLIFLSLGAMTQAPQKMSFQAVIRSASGQLVINAQVGMRISILQGSASGTPTYVETQTAQTNGNGLISLEVGSGNAVSGSFQNINWSSGPYFIKTETDPAGGNNYSILGTSQLLSVPYALYAEKLSSNAFQFFYADRDGDGFGDPFGAYYGPSTLTGYVSNNTDCNDQEASAFPGATEICDGIDNNCNGQIDEGLTLTTYYLDADGDNFGNLSISISTCAAPPSGYVINGGDCDDSNPTIFPGVSVACQGNNVGICNPGTKTCQTNGNFSNCVGQVLPLPAEICGNGIDDDCNGIVDDGC